MHERSKFASRLGKSADRRPIRDITGDRFYLCTASSEDCGHFRDGRLVTVGKDESIFLREQLCNGTTHA
jgi:hypothetical protein